MQLSGRHCFLLLVFFTSFLVHTGTAQQLRYAFKNYTPNDGLPSSEVHKVLQDAQHYMWFATDHGVCRYNGYEFKTFNLADNSILGLYEDYKKRIWAWSFSGRLFVFEDGKFEEYKWNKKLMSLTQPGIIQSLHVDDADNLYVASSGPHSYKFTKNGEAVDLLQVKPSSKIVMLQTGYQQFFSYITEYPMQYNKGIRMPKVSTFITVKMNSGTYKVEVPVVVAPERFKIRQLSDSLVILILREFQVKLNLNSGLYNIKESHQILYDVANIDGYNFYATDDGLVIKNNKDEEIATYLKGVQLLSIKKDSEGGLWLTSLSNGVFYLQPSGIAHLSKNEEIIKEKFSALYVLKDSSVLAGLNDGRVFRFKPNYLWQQINLEFESVASFYEDSSNVIFVAGVTSKVLQFGNFYSRKYNGQLYQSVIGLSNFIKQGENIYTGVTNNLVRINVSKHNAYNLVAKETFRVSRLYINHKKEILVGNVFGLWRYIDGYIFPYDTNKFLYKTRVIDITEINKNILLVGTRGQGLLVDSGDSLVQITEEKGLVSNNVRRILVDGNYAWVATNKGISVLHFTSYSPIRYTVSNISASDGLLSNEVNELIFYGQYIIAGTNAGASFLLKNSFVEKGTKVLPFYISSIYLGDQLSKEEDLLQVSNSQRRLVLRYEALSFSNVGKLNYRYRLSGFDSTWFYTNNLELQFNPLPYGFYRLEIQAKREFDRWDDKVATISLLIQCKAPVWKTPLFWIAVALLIILGVFLYYRKREKEISKRQQEKEQLQQRISETEQLALKSQMNPHFIFNSLNSIQQYVIDRDVKGANSFISGFSKLMRQTLDFSSKEKVALPEEIGYLQNYLELERVRMESKFDFTIIIETTSPIAELRIPPLLLQPYVENALRHGVRYLKDESGHIALSFIEKDGVLDCVIEDNGIGREKAGKLKAVNPIEYQSKGMSLTAERVELLNRNADRKIVISITDLTDANGAACGTRVSVKFPV